MQRYFAHSKNGNTFSLKNDDIYHAETTTDDNMLETAYNMLLFVLKNILGREIK